MMERPTWRNTLSSNHARHALESFLPAARRLGYTYYEWNGRVFDTDDDNGMYSVGKFGGHPVCESSELDRPGGVQWCGGLRPVIQDAKLMAHATLRKGTTLLDIVSGRLMNALMAIVWPDTGNAAVAIQSVRDALDDSSLRGSDSDGSIATAVSALRVRVDEAICICEGL